MNASTFDSTAKAAQSGIDAGAKAVKGAVRAARKAAAGGLAGTHSRAADALDTAHDRADTALSVAEAAAIGLIDTAAGRVRDGARKAHRRASAIEASFAPRKPSLAGSPVTTALVGLGAGILLTALLAPRGPQTLS